MILRAIFDAFRGLFDVFRELFDVFRGLFDVFRGLFDVFRGLFEPYSTLQVLWNCEYLVTVDDCLIEESMFVANTISVGRVAKCSKGVQKTS